MKREDVSRRVNFSSVGNPGMPPPAIALSTDSLDFDEEDGFRATASFLVGPGASLEVSYMRLYGLSDGAEITDDNNGNDLATGIYSVLSQFGTVPPGGYEDTDQAARHAIAYKSDFDNLEVNLRSRQISPSCRFHWSTMWGIRYFKLGERFDHDGQVAEHDDPFLTPSPANALDPTERPAGGFNYIIVTQNDMVGLQTGGDVWFCVMPGFMIGADAEAGVYGNEAIQYTTFTPVSSIGLPISSIGLHDSVRDVEVAGIGEANLMAILKVTPQLTLRAGYQVLYVTNVALAPEQFNPTPFANLNPPAAVPARVPFINMHGDLHYQGWTAGLEWTY